MSVLVHHTLILLLSIKIPILLPTWGLFLGRKGITESISICLGDSNQKLIIIFCYYSEFCKVPYLPPRPTQFCWAFTFNQDDRKNISCKIQTQHREALKGNQNLPCLSCCIMSAWAVTKDVSNPALEEPILPYITHVFTSRCNLSMYGWLHPALFFSLTTIFVRWMQLL